MEKFDLLTITGAYWHFHPLGTGIIFTYHTKAKQVLITCAATGRLINVVDKYKEGGYENAEQFKEHAKKTYEAMISDNNVSMDFNFYKEPTSIGNSMIEVDFNLIRN